MINFKRYENHVNCVDPERREQYNQNEKLLRELFWLDSFADIGIPSNHPKAEAMKDFSWSSGHANGYSEVYYILRDIWEKLVK